MGNDDLRNFVGERCAQDIDDERSRRETFARRLTGRQSNAPPIRSSVPPMMPSSPPTRSTLPPPPSRPPPAGVAALHLIAARAAAKLRDLPEAAQRYRAALHALEDPAIRAEYERFQQACLADQCILQGKAEEHNHHWAEAAALFTRAFEARHDAASAAHAATDIRRAKLDLHQAARFAEYAVSKAPGRADFHLVLGLVYKEAGLAVRARGEFERALLVDPGNEHATKLLAQLAGRGRET